MFRDWSKSRLAMEAGLSDTVLRYFDRSDWNPTVKTIKRIESVIPRDFDATGDAVIDDATGSVAEKVPGIPGEENLPDRADRRYSNNPQTLEGSDAQTRS